MAKKAKKAGVTSFGLPENLQIGDIYGTRDNGEVNRIKEIHELCATRRDPHIHLLTDEGPICLSFSSKHTTYRGSKRGKWQKAQDFNMVYGGGDGKLLQYLDDRPQPPNSGSAAMQLAQATNRAKSSITKLKMAFDIPDQGRVITEQTDPTIVRGRRGGKRA